MLELDEGRLDYLHYGLFEHPDEPVWQAQERASRRLWQVLPPPCRVLEVGIGVGTTLRRLREAGYRATGITPDAAQVAEVRARLGPDADVRVTTLEALPAQAEPFDLMLLQESAQYIDPLALFEAADRLLADDASIVVMDEFALARRGPQDGGLHRLEAFVALARRMGWTLEHDEDVSAQAAGTALAIGRLVERRREALQRELDLAPGVLDELLRSTRTYQRLYAEGVFGYRVLRLRRRQRPALRLAAIGAADAAAVRALFERMFGHVLSAAEWHWKYGDGRGRCVGLWQGDALVAHYGSASRAVRIDGADARAVQVGDVMVLPEANAGLGRQGALHQVSATLLEQQIGWGAPHLVGYGFPNHRAMKVAERLGLYGGVDEVIQLEWPAAVARRWSDAAWRVEEVDAAAFDPRGPQGRALDAAWRAMAAGLPEALLPVRDPAWLRHRYGNRPGVRYRLHLVRARLGSGVAGALVLREHVDHVELMDLVGPPRHLRLLVRVARGLAAAAGRSGLHAWITVSHAAWLDDPADAAIRREMGVTVPTCVHTPGPAPETLRGRWFLMAGDTDFR
jgi:SAM-dependent methyltransferase